MPKMLSTDDITDEGSAKSTCPSLSFCNSSLSLPSCDDPNV